MLAAVLGFAMAFISLTGCGGGNSSASNSKEADSSSTGEIVTIKVLDGFNGGQSSVAVFEAENQNIKVDYEYVVAENFYGKFSAMVAAGEAPDVVWAQSGFFVDQVKSGLLLDLTEELKGQNYEGDAVWQETFVPELLDNCRGLLRVLGDDYTSKNFGVPYTMTSIAIVYDKALFDKLGLKAPTTYEEFTKVNNTLKENGYTPLSMIQDWMDWYPRLFWDQYCRDVLDKDPKAFEDGTMTFKDPAVYKGLESFKEMWDKGWFPESGITDTRETMQQLFVQGKVAQVATVPNILSYMADNVPEGVELASYAFPGIAGKPSRSLGGASHAYGISKDSKHQAEALRYIKFLTSKTNFTQEYAKYYNSGLVNVKRDPSLDQFLQGFTDAAKGGFSPDIYVPVNATPELSNASKTDILPNYLLGKYDIDKVTDEYQKIYQESYLNNLK